MRASPSAVELLLLLLNAGASFFMTGLIWVMQVRIPTRGAPAPRAYELGATAAWSAQSLVAAFMLWRAAGG